MLQTGIALASPYSHLLSRVRRSSPVHLVAGLEVGFLVLWFVSCWDLTRGEVQTLKAGEVCYCDIPQIKNNHRA